VRGMLGRYGREHFMREDEHCPSSSSSSSSSSPTQPAAPLAFPLVKVHVCERTWFVSEGCRAAVCVRRGASRSPIWAFRNGLITVNPASTQCRCVVCGWKKQRDTSWDGGWAYVSSFVCATRKTTLGYEQKKDARGKPSVFSTNDGKLLGNDARLPAPVPKPPTLLHSPLHLS